LDFADPTRRRELVRGWIEAVVIKHKEVSLGLQAELKGVITSGEKKAGWPPKPHEIRSNGLKHRRWGRGKRESKRKNK